MIERIEARAMDVADAAGVAFTRAVAAALPDVAPPAPPKRVTPMRVLAVAFVVAVVAMVVAAVIRRPSPAPARSSESRPAGSSGRTELEEMTKAELYRLAADANLPGRSSMTKAQLLAALSSSS
ncbi:MAG: Rho termination factor N-terminal domain-containing protein [Acidimicrobiia bacterium]|nr:Rho termination factor N-terminal domain-containing protein [Acidimicrobiia bacterium]